MSAILTPDEEHDALAPVIDILTSALHARTVARDLAIGRAILAAVESDDPFVAVRALAADLGAETEQPRPPPVVVPEASALSVTMALRFRYSARGGVFFLMTDGPSFMWPVARPKHYPVEGQRVRLTYEYAKGEAEAAGDVAASWVGRMLMSGAESVVAEGEEVGT